MAYLALNGVILAEEDARISPLDRGFLYGDGLFETLKAEPGRVHFLARHLARLARGCRTLGIPYPGDADFRSLILDLLDRNGIRSPAAVKILVTRGTHRGSLAFEPCGPPTIAVFARPYAAPSADRWDTGLPLSLEREILVNPSSGICGLKTLNYLPFLLALDRAARRGFGDAALLNTHGEICECTTSNIFFFRGGKWQTPDPACGLLPGILRQAILECMADAGEPVLEVRIGPEELLQSDEIFVTNSLLEIFPVGRIEGKVFPERNRTRAVLERFMAWRDAQCP